MANTFLARPRMTKGHHYTALLRCRHQAALEYWGDHDMRLPVPPYLRMLQVQGLMHEADVERRLVSNIKLPDRPPGSVAAKETIEAMKRGPVGILQATFWDEPGGRVGVVDVLDHVRSDSSLPLGHVYRVGEIKRSLTLRTAHIMQIMFYSEMLAELQGEAPQTGFVILGDGQRHEFRLEDYRPVYDALSTELRELAADPTASGGAHLSRSCGSCVWRGHCLPLMLAAGDPSLADPVLCTPMRKRSLATAGMGTLRDVVANEVVPPTVSMSLQEWRRFRARAADFLTVVAEPGRGIPLQLRLPLPPSFDTATCVALIIRVDDQSHVRDRGDVQPGLYDAEAGVTAILASDAAGEFTVELKPTAAPTADSARSWDRLKRAQGVIVYGAGVANAVLDVWTAVQRESTDRSDSVPPKLIDLEKILLQHCRMATALAGLGGVLAHINGRAWNRDDLMEMDETRQLSAICAIRDWLIANTIAQEGH